MRNSEAIRYQNTVQDLLSLTVDHYCELGPGNGEVSQMLKEKGKHVCALEAPWDFESRTSWSKSAGISVYPGEFFTTNFKEAIPEKVECFTLIHCIAHLRYPPHIVLKQAYDKLEKGGYFYLSTVNGGSLDRVIKLFRGGAITEEVKSYVDMGAEYKTYCNPTDRYMIWDSWMHVKEYRVHELEKMFEEVGYKVVESKHRNNFQHWKNKIFCSIWPHLSEEIIIVGKKL